MRVTQAEAARSQASRLSCPQPDDCQVDPATEVETGARWGRPAPATRMEV